MDSKGADRLEALFLNSRVNAAIAWSIVGVFALVLVESALDRDVGWVVFTAATGAIVILPAVVRRSPYVMLPWELLALASIPMLVRAWEFSPLANTFSTYLAIAALALIITVELHVLARVRVTHWFAVGFVVLATLAVAGAWAIVRWNLDRHLGTAFLTNNEALMVEFAWVTVAGLAAGALFDLYFRDRTRQLRRFFRGVLPR